jgi:mRNA-degrading endonuclease HigB of HigAB toxin-antitoxin module
MDVHQYRGPLAAWRKLIEAKRYTTPTEVRADFPKVDFIGDYRAVFNIAKQYRLVCDMRFDLSRVFVRHGSTTQPLAGWGAPRRGAEGGRSRVSDFFRSRLDHGGHTRIG